MEVNMLYDEAQQRMENVMMECSELLTFDEAVEDVKDHFHTCFSTSLLKSPYIKAVAYVVTAHINNCHETSDWDGSKNDYINRWLRMLNLNIQTISAE
jgi:hypothetical protein